jgi:hypothetical protein
MTEMRRNKRQQFIELINPALQAGTDVLNAPMPPWRRRIAIVSHYNPHQK